MKKILFALLISASPFFASYASAEARSITVVGYGKVVVSPDTAILNLSVLTQEETPNEAFTKNSEIVTKVINAIKACGIEDKDLQTSEVSIYPQYGDSNDENGKQVNKVVAYQITNSLSVNVRKIENLNKIMQVAFETGVNQGGNVSFLNENVKKLVEISRKKAIEDAALKAKTLAEAAKVKLGHILKIAEIETQTNVSVLNDYSGTEESAGNPAIKTGQNTYETNIRVQYEIQ